MNFPSSPVVGQVYTDPTGSISYQWNGVQWVSTVAVPVATDADMNAGVADFIFATPKKLKFGFAIQLAADGYIKFPTWLGGLIIQWGSVASASGAGPNVNTNFTFPIAFPNACFVLNALADLSTNDRLAYNSFNQTGGQFSVSDSIAASVQSCTIKYIAIGH